MRSIALGLFASAAFIGAAAPALAVGYELLPGGNGIRIKGTGYNLTDPLPANRQTPPSTGVDVNWTIKAFANNALSGLDNPANLYIPNVIPGSWYSSSGSNTTNNPITFTGDPNTYRWATYAGYPNELNVAASGSTAQSYFGPGRSSLVSDSNYSYIVSSTFTLSKSSFYNFTYNTTADNRVQLYIGGCVTGADTQTPGINVSDTSCGNTPATGGILVAQNAENTPGQFGALLSGQTTVFLEAGSYDLNYVITDNFAASNTFGSTGLLIGASTFTEVPAPLPVVGAGLFFAYSRQLRRRIQGK